MGFTVEDKHFIKMVVNEWKAWSEMLEGGSWQRWVKNTDSCV